MANPTTLTFPHSPLVTVIGRLPAAGIRPEHFNPLWRMRVAFLAGLRLPSPAMLARMLMLLLFTAGSAHADTLWSATMTAGDIDFDEGVFAVGYQEPYGDPPEGGGELSDTMFDLRGNTYRVTAVFQYRAGQDRPIGGGRLLILPGLGDLDLESVTLAADGEPLEVDRILANSEEVTAFQYVDPGFRWTVGQRVDLRLTTTEPVPALPPAAAGMLALLLSALYGRRRAMRVAGSAQTK